MVVYFMKHGELRNQSPSVETNLAQNSNQIIYECCTLLLARLIIAKMWCMTSRECLEVLAADNVGR